MTTKKERYLQIKHQVLNDCGQCLGFRAKGISLEQPPKGHTCDSGANCHLNCPVLGTAKAIENVAAEKPVTRPQEPEQAEKTYIVQSCMRCGNTEESSVLLPCRTRGESKWVCTRCLPVLIHG